MGSISTQVLADGTLMLKPAGPVSISAESDADLTGAFDDAIEHGRLRILLDLSDTTLMDSSGLAALVRGWIHVRREGGDVVLASPAPSVRKLLAITRLKAIFKISETVADGLELLRSGDGEDAGER
jgi:anti-sigma B factor antagonist